MSSPAFRAVNERDKAIGYLLTHGLITRAQADKAHILSMDIWRRHAAIERLYEIHRKANRQLLEEHLP